MRGFIGVLVLSGGFYGYGGVDGFEVLVAVTEWVISKEKPIGMEV